jgi:glycosyltransferase involved in cell wall biosynthesis
LPPTKLALVLPAHNEAGLIGDTLRRVDDYLSALGIPYRIVVGDSASVDGTGDVVRALDIPSVHLIQSSVPGKGAILTKCFGASEAEVLGFIDADLEIDIEYVGPMLEMLDRGYDAVIASKTLDPLLDRNRPLARRLNTGLYNAIVRVLFRTPFRDHQAGLKLFRREALQAALPRVSSGAWLWDTELLVALLEEGCRVGEFPITTTPREDSRFVSTGTSFGLLRELVGLYLRTRRR